MNKKITHQCSVGGIEYNKSFKNFLKDVKKNYDFSEVGNAIIYDIPEDISSLKVEIILHHSFEVSYNRKQLNNSLESLGV